MHTTSIRKSRTYLVTYARASSRVEDFKEAADAYELFLEISPQSDTERRDRIRGLIQFYRQLSGLRSSGRWPAHYRVHSNWVVTGGPTSS